MATQLRRGVLCVDNAGRFLLGTMLEFCLISPVRFTSGKPDNAQTRDLPTPAKHWGVCSGSSPNSQPTCRTWQHHLSSTRPCKPCQRHRGVKQILGSTSQIVLKFALPQNNKNNQAAWTSWTWGNQSVMFDPFLRQTDPTVLPTPSCSLGGNLGSPRQTTCEI